MRLPTIRLVVTAARSAARRFPLVVGAGFVAAYCAIALIHNSDDKSGYTRLLVAATLAFPLLFALTLVTERRARTGAARWMMLGAGVAVLAAFWLAWPGWSSPIQMLRYVQLSIAFHLMVAFLPYAGYAEPNGFWQYNRALFLRFLTGWLYSSVLNAGLAIALLALNKLLGVPVPSQAYAWLWILLGFVFNPWFFVGGVPKDLPALDTYDDYPASLRIFTQFVLVPIVAIYLLILTLYLGKVVITRQWPNGWIGYLVSSVATVGILSWLLVHPLEERAEYAWVKPFTRGFYIALMPAIVMLWLAIWKRVEQYGITERRYFLIILSVWLAGIAVYYTLARSRSIKVIPATLCGVALLTFAGPWGAYAVSRTSQVNRLEAVLARNNLLANGVLRPTTHEVPQDDRREISSGLRYLLETHGASALGRWLTDSLRHALVIPKAPTMPPKGEAGARVIMSSLNLEYVPQWEGGSGEYFSYYANAVGDAVYIGGYTYVVRLSFWSVRDSLKIVDGVVLRLAADSLGIRVLRNGVELIDIPLQTMIDSAAAYRRLNPNQALPAAMLRVEAHAADAAALARFTSLAGTKRGGATRLTSFEGELFLRLPDDATRRPE